eukprot:764148-Hanusia_phi.AAC.5
MSSDVQTASSMIQMVVAYSTVIPNTSDLAQTASMLPPSMMCRVWHQQVCPEILLEKVKGKEGPWRSDGGCRATISFPFRTSRRLNS